MEHLTDTERELSHYEIERGKPMPSLNHGYIQTQLAIAIGYRYTKDHTLISELALEMPEKPNAVPDICIFPKLSIDFLHDVTTMAQMPLTAIEIISSSQSQEDILDKFGRYFGAGVKSCWLVMPSMQAIAVYSEVGKYQFFTSETTLSDPATGIELPLNEIFV